MNTRLEELKNQLRDDFGKITCWQWLCKDRSAATNEEQIAVAEAVLAMPRMDNVAAAHTYWLRLQGKKSADINDLLSNRQGSSQVNGSTEDTSNGTGVEEERGGVDAKDEEIRTV